MGALLGKPSSPSAPAVRVIHPRPVSSTPVGRFTSASDLFPSAPDSPISAFESLQQPQPQLSSPVVTRRIDLSRFHPKRSFDEGDQQAADSSSRAQHEPDSPDAKVFKDQLALLHIMKAAQPGFDPDGRCSSIVRVKTLSSVTA